MPPFDLDTAARFGTVPARMLALYLVMATRDAADQLVFDPDRRAGAGSSSVEYRVGADWFSLVPPPDTILSELTCLLRECVDEPGDRFTVRLGGHKFLVRAEIMSALHSHPVARWRRLVRGGPARQSFTVERASLELPSLPELSAQADEVLQANFDEDGCLHFKIRTCLTVE